MRPTRSSFRQSISLRGRGGEVSLGRADFEVLPLDLELDGDPPSVEFLVLGCVGEVVLAAQLVRDPGIDALEDLRLARVEVAPARGRRELAQLASALGVQEGAAERDRVEDRI